MWSYETPYKELVDLWSLPPHDLQLYVALVESKKAHCRQLEVGEEAEREPGWRARALYEQARENAQGDYDLLERLESGLLGRAVDGLVLDLAIAEGAVDEDIVHDPTAWLWRLRETRSLSYSRLESWTGIAKAQASQASRGLAGLGLDKLKEAAKRVGCCYVPSPSLAALGPDDEACKQGGEEEGFARQAALVAEDARKDIRWTSRELAAFEAGLRYGLASDAKKGTTKMVVLRCLELELSARGAVRGDTISRVGRALSSERDVVIIRSPRPGPRPAERWDWLFLALEFGWFDDWGLVVLLDPLASTLKPDLYLFDGDDPIAGVHHLFVPAGFNRVVEPPETHSLREVGPEGRFAYLLAANRPVLSERVVDNGLVRERFLSAVAECQARAEVLFTSSGADRDAAREATGRRRNALGWKDAGEGREVRLMACGQEVGVKQPLLGDDGPVPPVVGVDIQPQPRAGVWAELHELHFELEANDPAQQDPPDQAPPEEPPRKLA